MTLIRKSAIYRGTVIHNRVQPRKHLFRYGLFMVYIDLLELESLFPESLLWSIRRSAVVAFRRSDYLGDPSISLEDAIRQTIKEKTGVQTEGPIRMLTHLRYFGYCMNPVTFYYVFSKDDRQLECIVAEVNNTPWNERYTYVLPISEAKERNDYYTWDFPKQFHVSPFMAMSQQYDWRFAEPGEQLSVTMANYENGQFMFQAALQLHKHTWSRNSLLAALLSFPFITVKVIGAIYWEAIRLWFKKIPFHDHPKQNNPKGANLE
ncbi:MAG: DUF1365 domain-containing protein [bacterium]|nr:DUF1365 domain-containing protein [bacterium]